MRTDELKELEKLGFELSDCYQSSFEYLHANAKIER